MEIPEFVDEDTYDLYMIEIKEYESKMKRKEQEERKNAKKGEERFRREEEKAATATTEITTKSTEPDQGR